MTELERAAEIEPRRVATRYAVLIFEKRASESAAIRTGSKMDCVVLRSFRFYCAFFFCQPMKKFDFLARTELLVNDIARRVALGRRMVEVILGSLRKLRAVK